MKRLLVSILLFLPFALTWGQKAYTVETIPNPQTADAHNFVSNPDGILQASTVVAINTEIDSLRQATGTEMAVVAVNSIGNEIIEPFATKLFETWGIGKEKQDNGFLILFVLDQRKVRFETGYGLEGAIPDAVGYDIRTQYMIPEFQKGDYDAGMLAGVKQVVQTIKGEPFKKDEKEPFNWKVSLPYALAAYILLMLISFLWTNTIIIQTLKNNSLPTNLSRYKVIKENTSSIAAIMGLFLPGILMLFLLFFGSFMYILYLLPVPLTVIPAYLYGRLQMTKARRAPIPCKVCGNLMHILSEKDEDQHLQISQRFEEELKAVDYDVFVCDHCKNQAVFTLDKKNEYEICPKCKTKAFRLESKRTIVAPTYINAGTERTTYKCKFCGYQENNNRNLPRLRRTNSGFFGGAVGGGMFSGGGGFGGGGGGGSFGGGMSGGGGGTSGW